MSQNKNKEPGLTGQETDELLAQFDKESNVRRFTGIPNLLIKGLLLLFAAYVFWVTLIANLPEQIRRSAFLGLLIFIGYMLYPIRKDMTKQKNHIPWYDFVLGALGAAAFIYYVANFDAIIARAARLQPLDVYMGLLGIITLAELCRRVVGLPILVVAAGFVAYALTAGFSLRRVVHQLFYTTDGIIGTPIGVCSTFIVLFIFLASFLEKSGIANFFIDLANSVAGFTAGGPAKVAVIASALFGMISGSSVANTVGSGSVTIPTMKKTGYKGEFAAAVEASASTGGQLMPPIMGAAAFLMAELTGYSYAAIAVSGIFPAVLYFTGIFLMVHFEAKKLGLQGLPKEEIPHLGKLIITKGYLFLPIVMLIGLMNFGFTPAYAACYAIASAFVVSFLNKENRFTSARLADAFIGGSRNTIGVAIACAVAGIIVGIVSLTGIGQQLIGKLISMVNLPVFAATRTSLILALFFAMITCLILGMGVPTTANYVIMATIAAPMILRSSADLGVAVPIMAAHMFVFYFGIVADITPPVALAAYAGAAIAKSNPIKSGITATRLAITAFIIPYMFVFNPAMLLIDVTPFKFIQIILSSFIGMWGLAAGLEGFMLKKVTFPWRYISIAGGILLIYPGLVSDLLGLGFITLVMAVQIHFKKSEPRLLDP
ncbi:MAG: TRAP transporter permease [Treponema sp.]|nr:TRAP transporter permease [Treponema sp.]